MTPRQSSIGIDLFDKPAFEAELASLPGEYGPPAGRLLLAMWEGKAAGCVALRNLENGVCEMKRMHVSTRFQGRRIGRKLAEDLIEEAKRIGYTRMLLETGCEQFEARKLYRSLGFYRIKPYYGVTHGIKDMLIFMERIL